MIIYYICYINPNITFKEKSKIAKEILSKQLPVTLEQAKEQVALMKNVHLLPIHSKEP